MLCRVLLRLLPFHVLCHGLHRGLQLLLSLRGQIFQLLHRVQLQLSFQGFSLCWGAYAGLYYHYGIRKRDRIPKLSGIYKHHILKKNAPLFRGFDDVFYAPHSRATEITKEQILAEPKLELMAESDEAGVAIVKSEDSRQFFVFCHSEYDADTLKLEYIRDTEKGMNPKVPVNYFPDDDPTKEPVVNWRSAGQLLFTNWLNYYVYQTTPYDVNAVKNE